MLLAPHRQVTRSHRSIHCWHGHAARRSALPRERFSPLCEKRKSDRNRLCDNEGVPLICPTCQVLAQSVLTGDRLLLCMGLFSIFLVGSQSDAAWLRESCLKPHTPTRPLLQRK